MPRWARVARLERVAVLGLVLLLLVGALWAGLAGWIRPFASLLVVAGVAGAFLVRVQTRLPYDGGVWLTRNGVVHRLAGLTWSTRWDDVTGLRIDPHQGDLLVDVRGEAAPRRISTHLLVLAPGALALLIEAYRDHPVRRTELGTQASLDLAEQVRRDAQPTDYRPPVHGALRPSGGAVLVVTLVVIALFLALVALGRATG